MFKKVLGVAFASVLCLMISANASEVQESIINVESSSQKEVLPDTATIRFYVQNSGLSVSDIKKKNDEIVNLAISKIKEKLTPQEQIKTIAFSVNTVYNYKDKVRVFQKYEVKNGFEVKLKELDKISQIIKIAMDNGVKRVDGLNFSVENSENYCNELMAEAVKKAKNRAMIVAQASDTQLLKVKNINPYCSINQNVQRPRFYNATMAKASASDEAVALETIEPGAINIRAGVNMSYYLK